MFWAVNASREAVTGNATGMLAMTYFTSASDASSASGVLVVDVAAEESGNVDMEGVEGVAADADALTVGVVTATRRSGIVVGMGCADCVVVLSAGAKASSSMASRSNGQIPVLRKAIRMVPPVKASHELVSNMTGDYLCELESILMMPC